jgi:hypothetical protein
LEGFTNFFNRETRALKTWGKKITAHGQVTEHSEFPIKYILTNNNDWKGPYHWLCCEIINTFKVQLTNSVTETLKLTFLSCLEFGNFTHYFEKFSATA